MNLKQKLFGDLDFINLSSDKYFKEDSVREVIILPILKELGYNQNNIVRSKTLKHPFLKIGSNKKIPITLIPDYAFTIENSFAWVLDAKAPNHNVLDNTIIEQVYSYASHPEIRSIYFAICNGLNFVLFRKDSTNKPCLFFNLDEIDYHWKDLQKLLSPQSFQAGKPFVYESNPTKTDKFDYLNRQLLGEIPVKKQAAKRHFGVHGYFTKQSWNVVAEYIKHFTQPGDIVLDPFGGSGVTAVEALMNNRKAINVDLNPMAVFLLEALTIPVRLPDLVASFEKVKIEFLNLCPKTKNDAQKLIKDLAYPKGHSLPKGSDVDSVEQLFSDKQITELALLKSIIKKEKKTNILKSLLLVFSSSVSKINLTYHNSGTRDENAGNASAFAYYRYRLAKDKIDLDIINTYETKFKKLLNAKKEIEYYINENTIQNLKNIKGTATDLSWIENESIDYIYTDPPYGKKIPYLDLSVMWNAWLDLEVTEEDRKLEAIEGGELKKNKEDYNNLMAQSIKEMFRVLKYDRWMSFVFAHKDPEFWHLIIDTAESCGFEYAGAVPQKNGQTSFKKRQHPFTVLSGQLIINFKKVRNPKTILKTNLGTDISAIVMQTIEGIIAKFNGATLEQINDELIIKGLEQGFLDLLKKEYSDLTPLLLENFDYDSATELFTIKKNTKFASHLDVRLRVKYYLISFLKRKELEKINPHFDDIVLYIIPLLKNGKTPENQTILSVLEDIAERIEGDCWRLKNYGQGELFLL